MISSVYRNFLANLIVLLCSVIFFLFCGELVLRSYHLFKYGATKPEEMKPSLPDNILGWVPSEKFFFRKKKEQYKNGFRLYGDLKSQNKKIMIIGDSYVQATEVPLTKTFYSLIKNSLPVEVFAYGQNGYGTLQEYLVLDKYLQSIQPNIVVFQFCTNDFYNNLWELELQSKWFNNRSRRPYLTNDDQIKLLIPLSFPHIRYFAEKYSQLLTLVITRFDKLQARFSRLSPYLIENLIQTNGKKVPLYAEAVERTERIVQKIKMRVSPDVKIYFFTSENIEPYYSDIRDIILRNGIKFIDGVPEAVDKAEKSGIKVRTPDGFHWNQYGHKIVATVLIEELTKSVQ